MKNIIRHSILILCLISTSSFLLAQDFKLDTDFKKQTIEQLSELMNEHYVFPEVAQKTSAHLKNKLKSGDFDQFKDIPAFAEALTKEVQHINKDKHMRVRPMPKYEAQENTPERMIEEHLQNMDRSRRNTAGFREVKIMEGNVGYLDLRGFAGLGSGKPMADSYMNLMAQTDAVIVDLRKNGGGSPAMVQYLCSYFFDQHVHLNSLYWRRGDRTDEFWTLDEVGGEKMPHVPLFVLTSNYTFSGAEEFAYNMQTQKRATLIGETSGGGANPGGSMPINDQLLVFIPTGKAINPITKTNWEGVGVVPEIKTSAEEALDKAHQLAQKAAEKYRSENKTKYKAIFTELQNTIEYYPNKSSDSDIIAGIKKCEEAGLLNEDAINALGYDYLMQQKKPMVASCIFKANVQLFPQSANVYDSYGESLIANGNHQEAVKQYEMAVKLAAKHKDPNLMLFKENLKKAKEKIQP